MASNAGVNMSQFEQDFLASHNTYREKHGAPPLQLNRDICNSAQNWADYLLSIHTMKHSGGNVAVDAWYNEIKDYDFNNPEFSGTTGKLSSQGILRAPN
ncbi:hypothetical protein FKM82_022573 [Ascaphus truei]